MKFPVCLFVALFLLAGCASNYAWKDPKVELQKRRYFYVESELSDGKNLHRAIADELQRMGYKVDSGYLTMMPKEADTLVSFQSRWAWDFNTYLIELNIQVRDTKSGKIIASSGYHRPGIQGMATEELIRKTLAAVFAEKTTSSDSSQPAAPPK